MWCAGVAGEEALKAPRTKLNLELRTNRDAQVSRRGIKVASLGTGGQDPECKVASEEAREASGKQDTTCFTARLRVWILS